MIQVEANRILRSAEKFFACRKLILSVCGYKRHGRGRSPSIQDDILVLPLNGVLSP